MTKSIIFIDSRVNDYQSLIDGLTEQFEVVVIDDNSDGLGQMAEYLKGRNGIDAIHVISHGSQGTLYLGSSLINNDSLGSYQSQLSSIGSSLTDTGDILLYGCNVALGDVGLQFIGNLAQATGADVAASSNITGAAPLGGDWVLEVKTAGIDSSAALERAVENVYPEVLVANTPPSFVVSTGIVTTDIGGLDRGTSLVVQPNGKILVAGTSDQRIAVVRYNPDGTLDTQFSGDGIVKVDANATQADICSVALLADGKILVAGGGNLLRYNADGSLDNSFGRDGNVALNFNCASIALQSDGKILAAGANFIAIARYNPDGSPDTTFSPDGLIAKYSDPNLIEFSQRIVLQSDGKILLVGLSRVGGQWSYTILRYTDNGSLDKSFSTDGIVTTSLSTWSYYRLSGITLQKDGKILIAAAGSDSASVVGKDFGLVRYNTDGSPDTSFSGDGLVTTDISRITGTSYESGLSVVLQPDGKIVVAGNNYFSLKDYHSILVRYNTDGSLDSSFSNDGVAITESGKYIQENLGYTIATALQPDGKILVTSLSQVNNNSNFSLIRYNADGILDTSFGLPQNTADTSTAYGERSSPIVLNSHILILDTELAASESYNGATLTLMRHGGANDQDIFSNSGGTLTNLTSNSYFAVDGITIGRVIANNAGTLKLAFNANATQALVNKAMQQIAYSNTSYAPPATVQIDWTFNDGNTGAQGIGGALSVTGTTTVTITAVNDAPYLASPIADQRAAIGLTFQYQLPLGTFIDPDRDALSYTVIMGDGTGVPPWLTFDRTTLTFSGTPTASDLGLIDLQIRATDTSGTSASGPFKITVFRNSPPVSSGATTFCAEDTVLSGILPTATDANGDTITYARASNPANGSVAVSANGSYIYTPEANFNGTDSFTFTVSDGNGSSNTYTQTISVTAVNDAPVAAAGTLSVTEDIVATGTLVATDVDNTALTYSVVTQPAKGTVTLGANGAYTYTPAKDANGTDSFTFRASDGALSSNVATVSITVAPVNDAPVVALPLPDQSTPAGSAFTYTFPSNAFTDVDSAVLTYSAALSTGTTLPAWLSFNPSTRTFSGTPGVSNVGAIDVRVTASDGSLFASDVFSITVSDRPVANSYSPADGAKAVAVGSNLLVTFNGPVQRGTGAITLKTADGKVVETFTASNATVSGGTLTLNPTADLSIFTKYVVELGAGAVKDTAGNGNAVDSRYDFQTATQDGLYHFFVVAFAAAPGATYMGQLAEAVNYGLPLDQIVEIFTTKKQFTDVYPSTMTNRELATQLVNNIVKNSATTAIKQSAIDDIDAALGIGWSRGKMLYTVFGNLASKPLTDTTWGNTAKQFQNQLAVARYFTEEMGVATENLATLRGVIGSVTPDSDVSTVEKIVQIIGTVPPGG